MAEPEVVSRRNTMESGAITRLVLRHYPSTQAIYLFGSYGTPDEWPGSDVDIAIVLPPAEAQPASSMPVSELAGELAQLLGKEVDLVNLRRTSTVFQKEVVMGGRRLFGGAEADEFEVQVLWKYQKLNAERADILADGLRSGRFYQP